MVRDDIYYMRKAFAEAEKAYAEAEAPIGAVIVLDGIIIARGHNVREKTQNVLKHAELICIEKACRKLKSWRLCDCSIYVTLEPCIMCSGAIIQSRIKRLVFGAYDPRAGACGSVADVYAVPELNHRVELAGGVMQKECSEMLTSFFRQLREK